MTQPGEKQVKMPYGWGRVPFHLERRRRWMDLPFPQAEYENRIDRLCVQMKERRLDGLIVHGDRSDRGPIRYLTNFEDYYKGDSLVVIPLEGETAFITNSVFHGEPMHSGIHNCWIPDVRPAAHPRTAKAVTIYDHLKDILGERRLDGGRIGVSGETVRAHFQAFREAAPRCEFVEAQDLLPQAITIKSPAEVEVLRESAHALDAALDAVMRNAREGISENDLAAGAMEALFKRGAENGNFPMALSSGPRSGFKHVPPTDRRLQGGDMVFADLGGIVKGYASDASRGRVVGEPDAEQRDFLESQIEIVERCMAQMKPGTRIKDLGKIATDVAKERGVEQWLYFRGHGISTFSHVPPSINPANEARLEENMVFCFEPMLVREEFGTACVENMLWVTRDGVEPLNRCPWRWWD
ncbi:MAG: M24 family metallopeptidase [Nitrospinota bacterium]